MVGPSIRRSGILELWAYFPLYLETVQEGYRVVLPFSL